MVGTDEKHRRMFADKQIPEPPTLRDDYATRTDAAEAEPPARVFADLNRRDLKLKPPADLKGPPRQQWMHAMPKKVEVEVDGETAGTLEGEAAAVRGSTSALHARLPRLRAVGRRQRWPPARLARRQRPAENTIVIYTSDQGSSSATTGCTTSGSLYEESLRMPLLVRWPGVVKPGTVGDDDQRRLRADPARRRRPARAADMQGRSLLPILKGERWPADWRLSMYYRYYDSPGAHRARRASACGPRRTSSSTTGRRTSGSCSTSRATRARLRVTFTATPRARSSRNSSVRWPG